MLYFPALILYNQHEHHREDHWLAAGDVCLKSSYFDSRLDPVREAVSALVPVCEGSLRFDRIFEWMQQILPRLPELHPWHFDD